MAFLIGLSRVVLVVAILGSGFSGGSGQDISECGKLEIFQLQSIISRGSNCAEMGATPITGRELEDAKGIEDYRRFFVGYCQRESIVRDCLAEEANKYQVCQNETNFVNTFNAFQVYRGMIETLLDTSCKTGDSDRLATFWHAVNMVAEDRVSFKKVRACWPRFVVLVEELELSRIDNPSKTYVFYKEVEFFEQCIHQTEIEPQFKSVLHTFLTEIINRMKCINPKDGTSVLCGTIDVSQISSPSSCDVKTNKNEIPMYDVLEGESLSEPFWYLIRIIKDEFDIDSLRRSITSFCSEDLGNKCPDLTKTYSAMCLNETQQHEFRVLCETIEQASNGLCAEGGTHLTEILIKVLSHKNTSLNMENVIYECIDSVKSSRETDTIIEHSAKNLRFYHELETFKECLVSKFHNDKPFFDAVMPIYKSVREKVKCVNPADGTTVLCKEITF